MTGSCSWRCCSEKWCCSWIHISSVRLAALYSVTGGDTYGSMGQVLGEAVHEDNLFRAIPEDFSFIESLKQWIPGFLSVQMEAEDGVELGCDLTEGSRVDAQDRFFGW